MRRFPFTGYLGNYFLYLTRISSSQITSYMPIFYGLYASQVLVFALCCVIKSLSAHVGKMVQLFLPITLFGMRTSPVYPFSLRACPDACSRTSSSGQHMGHQELWACDQYKCHSPTMSILAVKWNIYIHRRFPELGSCLSSRIQLNLSKARVRPIFGRSVCVGVSECLKTYHSYQSPQNPFICLDKNWWMVWLWDVVI